MFDTLISWLSEKFQAILEWVKELLLWIPRKIWEELLDGLATVIESIPVPDFMLDAANAFDSIGGNVLFFAQKFAVGEGIAMVLAAYLLRFILRRIPLIG